MAENRIALLSENTLAQTILQMETDTQELKASVQRTGGSSVVFYQSSTLNAYDWSGQLTPVGGGRNTQFIVDVTASTQKRLFADLIFEIYRDGIKVNIVDFAVSGDSANAFDYKYDVSTEGKKRWILSVSSSSSAVFGVKVYIVANDQVTITVTPL